MLRIFTGKFVRETPNDLTAPRRLMFRHSTPLVRRFLPVLYKIILWPSLSHSQCDQNLKQFKQVSVHKTRKQFKTTRAGALV